MENQIKYRSYWKGVNEMVYFDKVELCYSADKRVGMFIPSVTGSVYMGNSIDMRFTGLQIKEKDLYAGDLFQYTEHEGYLLKSFIAEVILMPTEACFGYKKLGSDTEVPFVSHDELKKDLLDHCEIVGNIHENPGIAIVIES